MIFSFSTLFTANILASILIMLCGLYLRKPEQLMRHRLTIFVTSIGCILMRILIPIEFSYTRTISIGEFYPSIVRFLDRPLLASGFTNKNALVLIWVTVSVALLFRTIFAYVRFRMAIKKHGRLVATIKPANASSTGNEIDVMLCPFDNAYALGLRKKIIALPGIELTSDEHQYIIDHEMSHLTGYDLWIKYAAELLWIVNWWNPFTNILKRYLTNALEIQADLRTTESYTQTEVVGYLECLVKVARASTKRAYGPGIGLLGNKNRSLVKRFQLIANNSNRKNGPKRRNTIPAFVVVFVILFMASFGIVFEPDFPFKNEDGSYTISDDNSFFVSSADGRFELYVDGAFLATLQDIPDSLTGLNIYNSILEGNQDEGT